MLNTNIEKVETLSVQVTEIIKNLSDVDMLESERMSTFISTKPYLDKVQENLTQVVKSNDPVLKEKSQTLFNNINEFRKEFAEKYLSVKSYNNDDTTEEVKEEVKTTSAVENFNNIVGTGGVGKVEGNTSISSELRSDYIVFVDGRFIKTYKDVTKKQLNILLSDLEFDGDGDSVQIFQAKELLLRRKKVILSIT